MPFYDYECSACGHEAEIRHEMFDESIKKCPKCKKKKFKKIIKSINFNVVAEPTTIGQAIDKRMKKLGKYEKEAIEEKQKEKKELRLEKLAKDGVVKKTKDPWYGKLDPKKKKELASGDEKTRKEKAMKYIMTGE